MKEGTNIDKGDLYTYGWLVVLYIYLVGVSHLVPQGAGRSVWSMGGLVIIVIGVVVQDFYFMYRTNPYPYLRVLLYPTGKVIRLFIAPQGIKSEKLSAILWCTTIKLQFAVHLKPPVTMKAYGKVEKLAFIHEWPYAKRVTLTPGQCAYLGYVVKHPQTGDLIAYEYPSGTFTVEKGKPGAMFRMVHAPNDYQLPPISLSAAMSGSSSKENLNLAFRQSRRIESLIMENAALRQVALDRHEKYIAADDEVDHKDAEVKGLLEAGRTFTKAVVQRMLAYHQDHLTIENALKHVRGLTEPTITFNKWIAATLMFLSGLVFLWTIRDYLGSAGLWFTSPINVIASAAAIIAVSVLLYFFFIHKKRV